MNDDLISRVAAIDAICDNCDAVKASCPHYPCGRYKALEKLPSAQPEPCEDAVSRADVVDMLEMFPFTEYSEYETAREVVKRLPTAQPERKTGWWLIREGISDAQCSECKMYFIDVYDMDNSDAFCRHCGAKMEGLKVVEDE